MAAVKRVLIAGAGPAALEGALALRRLAGRRVEITLVSDQDGFFFRPASVAEPFGHGGPLRFSLDAIAADCGFARTRGTVCAVDPQAHALRLADGREIAYDALLLAIGADAVDAVEGALRFAGHPDVERVRAALDRLPGNGRVRVASVAAPATAWTLPAYELALLTARWAAERALALDAWVVTHEARALDVFGEEAARSIGELLEAASVRLWTGAEATALRDGRLLLGEEGGLPVDLAIALPAHAPRRIDGLPEGPSGFVKVDELGRVAGIEDVYAVGDMTAYPLKQGGLAAQQADAAASAIAAWSGAPVTPEPYRPLLRGLLLTGTGTRRLHPDRPLEAAAGPSWPAHKLAARELAPYLAAHPEFQVTP
jgi:sulfide:quinone oxidoreductase